MKENTNIVKYHNDLNSITFYRFGSIDFDLFMSLCSKVANEGKMVCVVSPDQADDALRAMRANPYGADAAIIGRVVEAHQDRGPSVFVRNAFGGRRVLDMLVGEQLPRIC